MKLALVVVLALSAAAAVADATFEVRVVPANQGRAADGPAPSSPGSAVQADEQQQMKTGACETVKAGDCKL
jgi:pantothenate synthetase